MVTEEGTTLSSPGYDADGFYHDRMECNWLIKVTIDVNVMTLITKP